MFFLITDIILSVYSVRFSGIYSIKSSIGWSLMYPLSSTKPLSTLTRESGFIFWEDLVLHIQNLPYGRNSNRTDLSLILKEQKGSCSSKHAFLAEVAKENLQNNIQLILGLYQMNTKNTLIGNSLKGSGLTYIPEAHCYLKINNQRVDVTSKNTSFKNCNLKNTFFQDIEFDESTLKTSNYQDAILINCKKKGSKNKDIIS